MHAFLSFRCSIFFSIFSKETSLNKKGVAPLMLIFITKMLAWFMYLSMTFSTVSVYSLILSIIREFSFISKVFVAFWKNKFISSETRLSSGITLSSFLQG